MSERVEVEIDAHVAVVSLSRPEKMNALDRAAFDQLAAAGEALKKSDDVRVVILTATGENFCAGIDLTLFAEFGADMEKTKSLLLNPPKGEAANWFQKPCRVWQELQMPVIAAISGVCFGGGLQLALAADFRIAAPDARLSIMETKWGIIPDMGITQSLPRLMRADQAKELMMTARVLDGADAAATGLVTRVANNPLAEARALARALLSKSPDAVQGCKALVDQGWATTAQDGLALERSLQAPIIGGANQMESVIAAMQKRAPKFQ